MKVLTRIQIGMDKSIWIGVGILTLLILLFVVHVSHPITRQFLMEGFKVDDYTRPSVDLTTEPDFMAFYKFHTGVCVLWNNIIDESMKNDCIDPNSPEMVQARKDAEKTVGSRADRKAPVTTDPPCPSKPNYIKNLLPAYRQSKMDENICFIECEKVWDAKSTTADLLAAIPLNINCYRGTLQFIIDKTTATIDQANEQLSRISEAFADYDTKINCKADAVKGTACTDPDGNIYIKEQKKDLRSPQQIADLIAKQKADTNTIIGRCRTMMTEIPELKQLMKTASDGVEKLRVLKKKAENGDLLPQPAKSP